MAKITWTDRENSGVNSAVSASIFNDTKTSVNDLYDVIEAQLGTTSSTDTANLSISGTINVSGSIIPNTNGALSSSFDLGSETAAWRDLYVSTGSLKFVGPGGVISSMSKQDVDNIKEGKPIPSEPKALDREGDTITVSAYNETDALVSQDDPSDQTYILFDRDGANRDRITFTAGNDVLTTLSEAVSSHNPDNTRGTVTLGKNQATVLLNASDTVVPSGRTLAISGSEFVYGTRGLAPYNVPSNAFYDGTMTATGSNGIGLGGVVTASAQQIPQTSTFPAVSRVTFPTPPQSFTADPGRAKYGDGDYIEILYSAPFNDGFTATASFSIPFSMSIANGQVVDVNLYQLLGTGSLASPLFNGENSNAIRRFFFEPSMFPNYIVTGSLEGEWHLSTLASGASYPVTKSNSGFGDNGPTLQYYNEPIQILDGGNPLQLRVRNSEYTPDTTLDYAENAQIYGSPQGYLSTPGGWEANLNRNSNPWSTSAPLRVPDINQVTTQVPGQGVYYYNYRFGFGASLDLNAPAHINRVDNNEYWKINNSITDDFFNEYFGVSGRSNFGIGNTYLFDNHTESAYDPSTDADVTNTLLPGIVYDGVSDPNITTPYNDRWDSNADSRSFSEWQTFWSNNRRGGVVGTTTYQFGDSSTDGRFFHREYIFPSNYATEDINNNVSSSTINAPAGTDITLKTYVAPYTGKYSIVADIHAVSVALKPLTAETATGNNYGVNTNTDGTGFIALEDYLEDTYIFRLKRQKADGTIEDVKRSYFPANAVTESFTVKRKDYLALDEHGGWADQESYWDGTQSGEIEPSAYSLSIEGGKSLTTTGSSQADFNFWSHHIPGVVGTRGNAKLGYTKIQSLDGPFFGGSQVAQTGTEIDLEQGDILFMTVEIKTKELYGLDYGGNPKDASLTPVIQRFDAYAAGRYFGFEGQTLIHVNSIEAEIENDEYKIYIPEGNYGGLADDYPNAFFRIENENFPEVQPVSCIDEEIALGLSTGGQVIANGSFLSVGNLVSASGEFGGESGNYISCSSENVIAVGQMNVIHKRNQGAIGFGNETIASNTFAAGHQNVAEGLNSITLGSANTTEVGAMSSVAMGLGNRAAENAAIATGYYTSASGYASHTEGQATIASGDYTHTEVSFTTASGYASHAEGRETVTSAPKSHAEGESTVASGDASHAEGISSTASGRASHAEGFQTTASGDYSHASGFDSEAAGNYSYTEGYQTEASGEAAHAEGGYTTASGDLAHAEGLYTKAKGQGSHAEGGYTTADAYYAHAEGNRTLADSTAAHAEGYLTTASVVASHAEGYDTYVGRDGAYGHSEGQKTLVDGQATHAEGYLTTASGIWSHAEGFESEATGIAAHAEGYSTKASGIHSHAQGQNSLASGQAAHVEGSFTTGSGFASHAEGSGSVASGITAHAEGFSTTASGTATHAEGYFTEALYKYLKPESAFFLRSIW